METIDSIGFFFLCRIKEKGKDGESRGREKEGFLSPLISVDATVIVEKESNFLLSRVNEYYTFDRLNSIKNRIQDLYDISCTIFNEYYILSKQINLIIGFVNGKH